MRLIKGIVRDAIFDAYKGTGTRGERYWGQIEVAGVEDQVAQRSSETGLRWTLRTSGMLHIAGMPLLGGVYMTS